MRQSAQRRCLPISAAAMVMIASAHAAGARETGVEIRGLSHMGEPAGDWRAGVERTDGAVPADAPDVIAGRLRPDRIGQAVDALRDDRQREYQRRAAARAAGKAAAMTRISARALRAAR